MNTSRRFVSLLLLLIAAGSVLVAQESSGSSPAIPVERLLNGDGSLRPDAGYDGAVDIKGWRIVTEENGLPRFVRYLDEPVSAGSISAAAPGDENWTAPGELTGINGEVLAVALLGGDIYIGGTFDTVQRIPARRIARWDGTTWHALGEGAGNGVDGFVYTIAVNGEDVYVGGQFTRAGTVAAGNVARWGSTTGGWTTLGDGLGGRKGSFVACLDVANGYLYAGGRFKRAGSVDAASIARWSLTDRSWSALPGAVGDGVDGEVIAVETHGDTVYAGGGFTVAGGVPARNIAKWSAAAGRWFPIAGGINGHVNVISSTQYGIHIGGRFDSAGTVYTHNIVKWQYGLSRWVALRSGERGNGFGVAGALGEVRAITVAPGYLYSKYDTAVVYVGGAFRQAGPGDMRNDAVVVNHVARWYPPAQFLGDTTRAGNLWWDALGDGRANGVDGFVNGMAGDKKALYVVGSFGLAGGRTASRIARWDGLKWGALGTSVDAPILSMAALGNTIYAAGRFSSAGEESALARFDGTLWRIFRNVSDGEILAVVAADGYLYVGGQFTRIGGIRATNVARWNSVTDLWEPLGESGAGVVGTEGFVDAIAVRGTSVYVGGKFTVAEDVKASNVAVWSSDTRIWSALGGGVNGFVLSAAILGNDLIVGGDFGAAGGSSAANVARWDGTAWHPLAAGVAGKVRSLVAIGADLYAGGSFDSAGGAPAANVARWNGSAWSTLGAGVGSTPFPTVETMMSLGGDLYVAGAFEGAAGDPAANIARWDGTAWHPLGGGTDNTVRALAVVGGSLYVAGDFFSAGGKRAYYFAKWR